MSKKTDTIEIRICPDLKAELSNHCKDRNQPMSAMVRDLVQSELSGFTPNQNSSKDITMTHHRVRDFAIAGTTLIALGLIWNAVTNPPAMAQATARMTFAEMDFDNDGIITREEYTKFETHVELEDEGEVLLEDVPAACLVELEDEDGFTYFDSNNDGKIVFGEMQTEISQSLMKEFSATDVDQDGFLSIAEFGGILSCLRKRPP